MATSHPRTNNLIGHVPECKKKKEQEEASKKKKERTAKKRPWGPYVCLTKGEQTMGPHPHS